MAIIYRTAGPWGAGKGANLVAGEVDGNFYDLNNRLTVTEETIPELVSISFFEVSGSSFYIHMTDGTIQGPFALPMVQWYFRGGWLPSTHYNVNDVVTFNGGTYMVLFNHLSGPSFDPGANDGAGHPYYGLLLTNPANVLPVGGLQGQYLFKTSDLDYEVGWQTPTVFPAQALREAAGTAYVLTLDNIASYVRCVSASGCTIVVPSDINLNFPLSTEISFRQCTAALVKLRPDTGVIFNTIAGFLQTDGSILSGRIGAVLTAKKVAPNSWDIFGLLGV
jgi:hypothetical protein